MTDTAPTAETADETAADSALVHAEKAVHDLLTRLRLELTGQHVATVLDWLGELGVAGNVNDAAAAPPADETEPVASLTDEPEGAPAGGASVASGDTAAGSPG